MTRAQRLTVAGLVVAGIACGAVLVAFAANSCPVDLPARPCPNASLNVTIVVALSSVTAALLVVPFAFLADFAAHRRIVYRGAWWRAARRGAFAGALVAILAGLRLGNALTVPVAIFIVLIAVVTERFLTARGA